MNYFEQLLSKHIYSKLFKRKEAQLVANNTIWIMLDRFIRIALGMVTGVWVARYLGPSLFGQLSYANNFSALFLPIATLAMDSIVVRELSTNPQNKNTILGTSFIMRLVSSFIAILLSIFFVKILDNTDDMLLYVFILTSCYVFQSFDIIDLFFQSLLKSKYSTYIKTFVFILLSGVKVGLIYTQSPLWTFVLAYAVEISLGSLGLLIVYLAKGEPILMWKFDKQLAKSFLKDSIIIIVQSFSMLSLNKLDQVILGNYVDSNELGQYSVAMRMIDVLNFIPTAIYASYTPKIAESKNKSLEIYKSKLRNYYTFMFYIGIILAIPVFFLGDKLIPIVFGQNYLLAGSLFSLSVFRLLSANLSLAKGTYYLTEGLFKHALYCYVFGGAACILINFVFIPKFGSIGAILGNIAGFIVTFIIVDLFNSKTRTNFIFMLKSLAFINKGSEN